MRIFSRKLKYAKSTASTGQPGRPLLLVPHMRNRAGPIADGRERQLQGGVFRRQGAALVYFLPHRLKQNPGAWPGLRVEQPLG